MQLFCYQLNDHYYLFTYFFFSIINGISFITYYKATLTKTAIIKHLIRICLCDTLQGFTSNLHIVQLGKWEERRFKRRFLNSTSHTWEFEHVTNNRYTDDNYHIFLTFPYALI
jgi:hypothetical protein